MELKRGINIGNHFENEITTEDFKYPIKPWYIGFLKECGFDHIRLPVKWSYHCDDENGSKIDEKFAVMVDKAIDEFLDAGFSIVLNVHHFREAMDNPKDNEPKLIALWQQIGKRYKNYPEQLIFEVLNEPTWRTTSEEWQEVQDDLIAVIRETNPTRQIMICGIDYSGLFKLAEITPPADDKNIIGTFHYYFPFEFTHQGANWTSENKDLCGVTWEGTDEDMKWARDAMRVAKEWSDKYGLPVNIGEFGAYSKGDIESRSRWTKATKDIAEEYGFSWTYWELNYGFGICEREEPKLIQPLGDALLK